MGTEIAQKINPNVSEFEARNFTLMNLFALFENQNMQENSVLLQTMKMFDNMSFQIGITNHDEILTGDCPFYIFRKKTNELSDSRPEKVIFPLTSNMVMYLLPTEKVDINSRNCLFSMDNERIREEQWCIAFTSQKWLYSKSPLSKETIDLLLTVRKRSKS